MKGGFFCCLCEHTLLIFVLRALMTFMAFFPAPYTCFICTLFICYLLNLNFKQHFLIMLLEPLDKLKEGLVLAVVNVIKITLSKLCGVMDMFCLEEALIDFGFHLNNFKLTCFLETRSVIYQSFN